MKILSLNAGYFLGYTGTPADYVMHPWKAVTGSKNETAAINEFVTLVRDIDPDAVALQELDTGSIRTRTDGQMQYIADRLPNDYTAYASTKYGNRLFRQAPILQYMANGTLCKQGTVQDHYLDSGVKSLVQEVQIEDMSMFSVHLARFGTRTRQRQLRELAELISEREQTLIVGDFNAMNGASEADLLREHGLSISSPGNTFPSSQPTYPLDLTAYSQDLNVGCRTLDCTLSDHRPILVSVDEPDDTSHPVEQSAERSSRPQQ